MRRTKFRDAAARAELQRRDRGRGTDGRTRHAGDCGAAAGGAETRPGGAGEGVGGAVRERWYVVMENLGGGGEVREKGGRR